MKRQNILGLFLLAAFVLTLLPVPAQAQPDVLNWTVETVEVSGLNLASLNVDGGDIDLNSEYPAFTAVDANGVLKFVSRQTGSWVKTTIHDPTATPATTATVLRSAGNGDWGVWFTDPDAATEGEYYTSTDNGATWAATAGNIALPQASDDPARYFYEVDSDTFSVSTNEPGGAGQPVAFYTNDGGLTWTAQDTSANNCFNDANSSNRGHLTYRGGTTFVSTGINTLDSSKPGARTSTDDCATAATTRFLTANIASAGQMTYQLQNGAAYESDDDALGQPFSIYWIDSPYVAQTATIIAEDVLAASQTIHVAEDGLNVAIGYAKNTGTDGGLLYSNDGGTTWNTYALPSTIDFKTNNNFRITFSEGRIWMIYREDTTNSIKAAYTQAFIGADAPEAPAGLSGLNNADTDAVRLRFPLSVDDPNQDDGDFEYHAILNGGLADQIDTDGGDGGGFREMIITVGGEADVIFQVYALDTTTGEVSDYSCAIFLDMGRNGDTESCGTGVGLGGSGGTADTFLGTDLQSAADQVGMDVEGLRWFIGLMLVLCIAAPLFLAFGAIGGGLGALVGVALSIGFGLIPIWFVVLIVIVSLAAIAFLRR